MSFTFCANSSCSVRFGAVACSGGGAALTVTRAVASCVPPAPFAIRWYVVEVAGETWREPLVSTGPMPSMLTSVAPVVCHVRVVDSPALIVLGFAASEAVGACAVGGAGGGGGGNFFAHALRNMIVPSANTRRLHILIWCFTDSSDISVRPIVLRWRLGALLAGRLSRETTNSLGAKAPVVLGIGTARLSRALSKPIQTSLLLPTLIASTSNSNSAACCCL